MLNSFEAAELAPEDFHRNVLWDKLKRYISLRVEELRRENEADLSPEKTAKLRGRIAELQSLAALEARFLVGLEQNTPPLD